MAFNNPLAMAPAAELELCDTVEIPLMGRVAAGMPYAAFPLNDTLTVPKGLWKGNKVFALRVQGDSMIDEGIHNGDHIIVESRPNADDGQTVVAEIDGSVTVKKLYRAPGGQVRLQPANPELLPLIVRGDNVRIIGVVVGILRKFGFGHKQTAAPAAHDPITTRPPAPKKHARQTAPEDAASLELALNALERELARWKAAMDQAQRDRKLRRHVAAMAELGRSLESLRDWYARTNRPGLRRALLQEANKVLQRMQRFKPVAAVEIEEVSL
jgi:repressor LexA